MNFGVKISCMDSCGLVSLPSPRPSHIAAEHGASLDYIVGYVNLAVQEVNNAVRVLPASRGMWDYLRSVLTDMAQNVGAQLLSRHGLKVVSPAKDRFWFTLGSSPYPVHVVARPQNAGKPPKSGKVAVRGLYSQPPLPESGNPDPKEQLYLMVSEAHGVLESVTLALVANSSYRWRDQGVRFVEEITIYLADDISTSLTTLPPDDEDAFRSSMTRRVQDGPSAASHEQDVQTYQEDEDRDEQQGGERDAG